MEPKKDLNDINIPWNPISIPASKPFVNIYTTAYEPITSLDDMNFVKTRSTVYSTFHKNSRIINFDIGYSKQAKWFESLSDKWNEYSNFCVSGFLEDVYSINENNKPDTEVTYAQINAKIIDYDIRFRQQKNLALNTQSASPKSTNVFTKRKLFYENQHSSNSSSAIITNPLPTTPQNESNDKSSDDESVLILSNPATPTTPTTRTRTPTTPTTQTHTPTTPTTRTRTRKRRQLSDLCDTPSEDNDEMEDNDETKDDDQIKDVPITPSKPKRTYKRTTKENKKKNK
jgi:hypothetical protein